MGFRLAETALSLLLYVVHSSWADDFRSCRSEALHPCQGNEQICDLKTGFCVCPAGFEMSGSNCVQKDPGTAEAGGDHGGVAAAVVIVVTALLAIGVVLIVRKYKLVEYARRRLEARRNRDVMYEDVMIGQDDPPLTP